MKPFNRTLPNNQLPLLPPKVQLETVPVLKKTIAASRALAQLNGALGRLPNPAVLLDTLSLQEAQASSEIENIITTQDELFKAIISEKTSTDPATKEVIRYKDATWLGYKILFGEKRPLSTNVFIRLVQCIKANTAGIRNTPGTQLKNSLTSEVLYTPPDNDQLIRDLLANLEQYIHNSNEVDPLIKMAVTHYQFEAIHPFSDGNGRTGRIINILYLLEQGLLTQPVLYLSKYIIRHKTDYYALLRAVTEQSAWESWILFILDAIEKSATESHQKIEQIAEAINQLAQEIQEKAPKVYSKDLVELLFCSPYCKRNTLVNAGIGSLKTAGEYLMALEELGFLESFQVGKEKLYLNKLLFNILKI